MADPSLSQADLEARITDLTDERDGLIDALIRAEDDRDEALAALSAPEGATQDLGGAGEGRAGFGAVSAQHGPPASSGVEQQPDQVGETQVVCDGGYACPAEDHIEGCYTGEGYPGSRRPVSGGKPGLGDLQLTAADHRELLGLAQQELESADEGSMWFDPDDFARLKALEAKLRRLASRENPKHEHEWVDMRNVEQGGPVESGEMCVKCHAIRASVSPSTGEQDD